MIEMVRRAPAVAAGSQPSLAAGGAAAPLTLPTARPPTPARVAVMNRGASVSYERGRSDVRQSAGPTVGELPNPKRVSRGSYAAEIKATLRSIGRVVGLVGKRLLGAVTRFGARHGVLTALVRSAGSLLRFVTPVVSIGFAAASIVKAMRVCRDLAASGATKALAVTDAVFDTLFVSNPVVGVIGNLAVAGLRVARALRARRHITIGAGG